MQNQFTTQSKGRLAGFIGGSDARVIMGDDDAALLRLWREKRRGRAGGPVRQPHRSARSCHRGPQSALVRSQYRANHHGCSKTYPPPRTPLDGGDAHGRVESRGAVFEAKFMLPWSFSEEGAVEKYGAHSNPICGSLRPGPRCLRSLLGAANGSKSSPMPIRFIST